MHRYIMNKKGYNFLNFEYELTKDNAATYISFVSAKGTINYNSTGVHVQQA